MIIAKTEFLALSKLDPQQLDVWVTEEWLVPQQDAFTEADLARVQLIKDLQHMMGVNDEGVGVALHLLDQLHNVRHAMTSLLEEVRKHEKYQDKL
jgi:chaperone modulatory protein CbpM